MQKNFILLLIIFVCSTVISFSQVKKEIIPMHSNCNDVKTILGVETCKKSHEIYNLENEIIEVTYSTDNCHTAYGKKWNVPIGTVTSVTRMLSKSKIAHKLKDFGINLNKCNKTIVESDHFDQDLYSCREEGISLYVVEGDTVTTVIYTPTLRDFSCLLCK